MDRDALPVQRRLFDGGRSQQLVELENELEGFERSKLGSWEDEGDYHPGPGDDSYSAGVRDDDGWE